MSQAVKQDERILLHQNRMHVFDLADNIPSIWPTADILNRREHDILPAEIAAQFEQAVDACLVSGEEQTFDFDMTDGPRRRTFEGRLYPDIDGVCTIITDVTDRVSREAAFASLLREVSHRSKNLLAIVQSVAMQTAHHSEGIQDFLDKFRGRLHALSSTQDLVTESDWRGTYFQSLVTAQLTRIGHAVLHNMRITGDNPLLGPNASLHIGLAIHELAANASLHGSLSEMQPGSGQIWVDAKIVDHPGEGHDLIVQWQETRLSPKAEASRPHFGTLVLERIVPLSVGGVAKFSITDDAVTYRLVVPADQFEA